MKRVTFELGVIVAGLALAASPALAQRPSESGSGSPHTGGGVVNSGGGGGGNTAAPSGVAMPASSGMSSGSSGGTSSPSAGAGMAPSMSGASAAAPRQAAPVHRAGWSAATAQGRFTGAQHTATGYAIPRNDSTPVAGSGSRVPPGNSNAVPGWARPRGDNASSDTAVPRTTPRPQPGNTYAYVYSDPYGCLRYLDCGYGYGNYYGNYLYYDPFYGSIYSPFFGYGMGLGLGGYPVFDPGFGYVSGDDYNYGVGSYSTSQYSSHEEGNLKLKVKPRSAKVYVDGYFVGVVDEFDGMFQKLPLTAGRHHVKIQADGYQAEEFDAVINPQQTVTFQGTLKKLQ